MKKVWIVEDEPDIVTLWRIMSVKSDLTPVYSINIVVKCNIQGGNGLWAGVFV